MGSSVFGVDLGQLGTADEAAMVYEIQNMERVLHNTLKALQAINKQIKFQQQQQLQQLKLQQNHQNDSLQIEAHRIDTPAEQKKKKENKGMVVGMVSMPKLLQESLARLHGSTLLTVKNSLERLLAHMGALKEREQAVQQDRQQLMELAHQLELEKDQVEALHRQLNRSRAEMAFSHAAVLSGTSSLSFAAAASSLTASISATAAGAGAGAGAGATSSTASSGASSAATSGVLGRCQRQPLSQLVQGLSPLQSQLRQPISIKH